MWNILYALQQPVIVIWCVWPASLWYHLLFYFNKLCCSSFYLNYDLIIFVAQVLHFDSIIEETIPLLQFRSGMEDWVNSPMK